MAAKFCTLLVGQFKRNDADEPEVFTRSLIAIMEQYPVVVLKAICSPTEGLAIRGDFLPTLFEIREACNETMRLMIARWQLDQLPPEKRNRFAPGHSKPEALPPPQDTPERRRAFLDGLKAKHGDHYGLGGLDDTKPKGEPFKVKSLGELTEHYRTHGLAFAKKPHTKEKNHADLIDAVPQGADGKERDQGREDA